MPASRYCMLSDYDKHHSIETADRDVPSIKRQRWRDSQRLSL